MKTTGNSCGFAILSASFELAFKILEQQTHQVSDIAPCEDDGGYPEGDPQLKERLNLMKNRGCLGFSKKKVADILNDKSLREFSQEFQNTMNTNEALISSALVKEGVCAKTEFIRLPVIIEGKIVTTPDQYKFASPNKYLLPNAVNGLVLSPIKGSSTFLYQKTSFDPIDQYVQSVLSSKQLGIKAHAVYAPEYWKLGGGLHCGSNTIPVCRAQ